MPDVAIPQATARWPGRGWAVVHILASGRGFSTVPMKNIVLPYMIIVSPGRCTPTLTASAAASIVPKVTGVPTGSPVASLAAW